MEVCMHIDKNANNGIPYLRVVESYSVMVDGVKKNRKRLVRNIGPLSRYDDGKPDYVRRLKKSFLDGSPMIESLKDLASANRQTDNDKIVIEFDKYDDAECFSDVKNIGYFLLDGLYDSLGIYEVLSRHKSDTKIEYDLNGLAKILVFGRVLKPDSKCETWNGRDGYAFEVVSSDSLIHIFRSLDALNETAPLLQKRMNTKVAKGIGRNLDICYYDVTNYWFEVDDNDDDMFDEEGNIIKEGLRKRGPSKAKNRKPIVQMGLFIDDNGIPVYYRLFPGNNIDQTTLRPSMKDGIDKMGFGRVVVVADGGLNSDKNIAHALSEGNGYILSKSTKKSTKAVKKWILDEAGYEWNDNQTFKVKNKIREREIVDEAGNKIKIKEKVISYWSLNHYRRELKENAKFVEYLESVIRFPDKLKDNEKKLKKYLKTKQVDKESGEVVDTKAILSLDMEKIRQYMDLMGYYTLLTSELDCPDKEIIEKYHGLSRIEDSFRVIKTDLGGRPVNVRTPEHVNAHFLVCFIALSMIRIIQHKILVYQGKASTSSDGWESGESAERIIKALGSYGADALPKGYYRLTRPDPDLTLIMQAFGVDAELRLPTAKELRQLKHKIDKATSM